MEDNARKAAGSLVPSVGLGLPFSLLPPVPLCKVSGILREMRECHPDSGTSRLVERQMGRQNLDKGRHRLNGLETMSTRKRDQLLHRKEGFMEELSSVLRPQC